MTRFLRDRGAFLTATVVIILLDRITKILVETRMAPHSSVQVIPGFFDLTYVENPGGVFGLFRDLPSGPRGLLFTLFPLLAVVIIVLYARSLPLTHRVAQTGLSLVMGGAVGNLIDRFRLGYVVDFLDVYWGSYHWPAFNVADSAITVGVILLLYDTFFVRHPAEENGAAEGTS